MWFDSGSTHAFVLRDRPDGTEDGIADVYMEGTDQHRGWFHSSLLQGCGTIGRAPYRNVVTHGFTLDEKGMKMSKSIGNTVVPQEVIDQYGADILRLWVAQADYTADQRIGPEILKGTADSYRRLRNTMRFMLGSLADFSEADRVLKPYAAQGTDENNQQTMDKLGSGDDPHNVKKLPELERWVLHRLAELDETVRAGYRAFDFQGVFQAVFQFATTDLSAFYFDIRKDALYCDGDTPRRRAARTVLDLLFHRLTTWLAPILVFTMEEVWLERFPGEESSIHLQDFADTPQSWRDAALAAKWDRIRAARRVVTAALEIQRRDKVIGASRGGGTASAGGGPRPCGGPAHGADGRHLHHQRPDGDGARAANGRLPPRRSGAGCRVPCRAGRKNASGAGRSFPMWAATRIPASAGAATRR